MRTRASPRRRYAEPLVRELLDPDGSIFEGRLLFRQHCVQRALTLGGHTATHCVKDLSLLG